MGTGPDTTILTKQSIPEEGEVVEQLSLPQDANQKAMDEVQATTPGGDYSTPQGLSAGKSVEVTKQSAGETFEGQSFLRKKARLLLAEEGDKREWFDGKIVRIDPKEKTVRFMFDESEDDFIDIPYDSPELQIVGQEVEPQASRPEDGRQRKQEIRQKLTEPKGSECVGWIVQYSLTDESGEKIGFEGKVLAYNPKDNSIRVVFDGEEVDIPLEDEELIFVKRQ